MHLVMTTAILSLFLLTGCGGRGPNETSAPNARNGPPPANADSAGTNVEELGMKVNVPYEAEDIAWKEDVTGKKLTAVFLFSPSDAERVAADVVAAGAPQTVSVPVESWFPDELVARGDLSGNAELKGTAYAADRFLQKPYERGRITRVEGSNYFILEVTAP